MEKNYREIEKYISSCHAIVLDQQVRDKQGTKADFFH